jgi:hypothetical protein
MRCLLKFLKKDEPEVKKDEPTQGKRSHFGY